MANGLMTDIPKEITDYKEKIIAGRTIRQIICLSLAIVVGFAAFAIAKFGFGTTTDKATDILIPFTIPFLLIGFFKKDGYPFEKYLMIMLKHHLGTKKKKYTAQTQLKEINEVEWNDYKVKRKEAGGNEAQGFVLTEKKRRTNCKRAKAEIKESRRDLRKEVKRFKSAGKQAASAADVAKDNPV